jgi:threonine synthase
MPLFPLMTLEHLSHFRCVNTGQTWPAAEALAQDRWLNERFGLDGILSLEYDLERVAADWKRSPLASRSWALGHWRYRELLPLSGKVEPPPLSVGSTPLVESPRLAESVGLSRLWIKDDGRNPTASLKDRPSSVAVVKALEMGASSIACASTGNAASSLAGFAAAAGLKATIFVPKRAPAPKIAQLLVFGARVLRVNADYDRTWALCQEVCGKRGWYNRNCAVNPYLVEGKKTCGLEIAEQMSWTSECPDWVVGSVGDGCSLAAIGKGLREMTDLGVLPRMPRLLGTQASGADPVTRAWKSDAENVPSLAGATTIADSICVGRPANGLRCLQAVRDANGAMISVEDEATLDAMKLMGRLCGIFGEPAASNALAGLIEARAQGVIGPNETAVVVVSGNGLKDISSAAAAVGQPIDIEPTAEAISFT